MMITPQSVSYFERCFSALLLLPQIHECPECGRIFKDPMTAELDHGVIRYKAGTQFTIIVGCEGYHTIPELSN